MTIVDPIDPISELRHRTQDSIDELKCQLIKMEQLMNEVGNDKHKSIFEELKGKLFSGLEELEEFDSKVLRVYEELLNRYTELKIKD